MSTSSRGGSASQSTATQSSGSSYTRSSQGSSARSSQQGTYATFAQSASAAQTAENANYGFIALLGLAQRLGVDILPMTWQTGRGSLDKSGRGARGGQAKIFQSYMSPNASFAFKSFSHIDLHELVSELLVLRHEAVRKHPFIARLEGLCFEVRDEDDVRPVLVFEMSPLGDLYHFVKTDAAKKLTVNDRLRICVEIGVAIRDMHANNIIHGDIKPQNILIFRAGVDGYTSKLGDFGFSTRFRGPSDMIFMPKSRVWHAPEWHDRANYYEDAKRMDVFSYGMVCLWMMYEVNLSDKDLMEHDPCICFGERCEGDVDLLEMWKFEDQHDELLTWATATIPKTMGKKADDIAVFLKSTIVKAPRKRELNIESLIPLLDPVSRVFGLRLDFRGVISPSTPARNLPRMKTFTIGHNPPEESFELSASFAQLSIIEFRLPRFIATQLKSAATRKQPSLRILPQSAALQLAVCYTTGFGVPRNEERAMEIINEHNIDWQHLERQVQNIRRADKGFTLQSTLFKRLSDGGFTPQINLPEYYKERGLLEQAKTACSRDIETLEEVVGKKHYLCLRKRSEMVQMLLSESRWSEAETILVYVINLATEKLGSNDRGTLELKNMLARVYREQGHIARAQKLHGEILEQQVRHWGPDHPDSLMTISLLNWGTWKMHGSDGKIRHMENALERRKARLGPDHYTTLGAMIQLGVAYQERGHLVKAEGIFTETFHAAKRVLGELHLDTLTSMDHLAGIYRKQGKYVQAGELLLELLDNRKRTTDGEDGSTLAVMTDVAVTYRAEGRLVEAASLLQQVVENSQTILGPEHDVTETAMTYLGLTYRDQGPAHIARAEELLQRSLVICRRLRGPNSIETLAIMNNLSGIYWKQKRWADAAAGYIEELEIRKKAFGEKQLETLTCMENLAWTYQRWKRLAQAKEFFARVHQMRTEMHGADHPNTVASKDDLDWIERKIASHQ